MKKIELIIIILTVCLLLLSSFYRVKKKEVLAQESGLLLADFNNDSRVDLVDFEIWRQNRFSLNATIFPTTITFGPTAELSPTIEQTVTTGSFEGGTISPVDNACRKSGQTCSDTNPCCAGLRCVKAGAYKYCIKQQP